MRNLVLTICLLGAPAAFAQTPVIQSVLNAADYSPLIAPGVWVAIFGSNLAPAATIDTSLPLPLQLGGVSVTLSGAQIPLRYVSAGQINALIPFGLGTGFYTFVVSTPVGTSAGFETRMSTTAPAFYTQNALGTGAALVFDSNFQPVTQLSTSPIVLYASGLGVTNPPGTAAGGNTSEPLNRLVTIPVVQIGGVTAQVLFAGLAPGLPGVYQLNVTPPAGPLADNTLTVSFRYGPPLTVVAGAVTTLPVATGLNTANLTGSVSPAYPVNTTVLAFSPLLLAANLKATFDILPGAVPFNVIASCQSVAMSIAINPAAGTWQATSSVPVAAERVGDFSGYLNSQGQVVAIQDFANNNLPFAGNIIPQSRLDPVEVQAAAAIPLPNHPGTNANFLVSGAIPSGGHFVIDGSNNSSLAASGGYILAPVPGAGGELLRTNPCSLTVDGVLVASNLTTFQ